MKRHYLLSALAAVGMAACLPSTAGATTTTLENFEFAVDTASAQGGVTVAPINGGASTVDSATGADKSEGSFGLKADYNFDGTVGFQATRITRTLATPVTLSKTYGTTGADLIGNLRVVLDMKNTGAFATPAVDNLWILLTDSDGDVFRWINFHDTALATSSTFALDHGVAFHSPATGNPGNGVLDSITAITIEVENPSVAAQVGSVYFDNIRIVEPTVAELPGLTYVVPLISPAQAPNVTDSTFDAIYAANGHQVIGGNDWKDYANRANSLVTPIGGAIAATSKAYIISDGTYLYVGMKVYDPNTGDATTVFGPDPAGDDSNAKWNVVDVEFAFSAQQGPGAQDHAVKFAMDAFSHIDDMIPDGVTASDTTAKTENNSYIIDANTWALEFKVKLSELIGNAGASSTLSPTLPAVPGPWYGHIGYQSTGDAARPLYAAGAANGFSNFTITYDLHNILPPNAAQSDWALYE